MLVIGAYEGKSLLSKAIQWESRSPISHVSIVCLPDQVVAQRGDCSGFPEGTIRSTILRRALDSCAVYEAWGDLKRPWRGGVFKREGIHEGHKPGTLIHLMKLDPGLELDEVAAVAFLDDVVREKERYDYLGLLRFLLRINKNTQNRWFCSELVQVAFGLGGVQLVERASAYMVAPGDIHKSPVLDPFYAIRTKGGGSTK